MNLFNCHRSECLVSVRHKSFFSVLLMYDSTHMSAAHTSIAEKPPKNKFSFICYAFFPPWQLPHIAQFLQPQPQEVLPAACSFFI